MNAVQKPPVSDSTNDAALRQISVRRWKNGKWEAFSDRVSPEVPVRVIWSTDGDKADRQARLWAWPDDLEHLCLGHVLLEGCEPSTLPEGQAAVRRLVRCLDASETPPAKDGENYAATFSVSPTRPPWLAPEGEPQKITAGKLVPEALLRHMENFLSMPGTCPGLWDDTGCFHRAGLLDLQSGSILRLAEDIGRHNCLDRLAGWACLNGVDTRRHALLLSARITASLYTKARRAGFSFLISRSAVTTAAVRRAEAEGVTLIGFCRPREGRFTVFAEAARPKEDEVLGVVLAGGLSSRLGEDKVRLTLPGPGFRQGQDMLTSTLELLRCCTSDVAVSCRASRDVSPWRRIPDLIENLGPLGGMYSVIKSEARPVLVLSCDLPFMTPAVLQKLLAARAARPPEAVMTTFRQAETGFIEALVAVYEPTCLPWFEAALAKGVRQLNLVVPENLRYDVVYTREEALPFFNINYPADLEAARRLVNPS